MQGTVYTSEIFAGSARQGHVEAPDGSKVWVLVYDADVDGLFNGPEDVVCVDVDGSESLSCNYDDGTELFRPGELFEYRGEILRPVVSPSGHRIDLQYARAKLYSLPLVLSASEQSRESFVRVINHSERSGDVNIVAIDDVGQRFGPVQLSLNPLATGHFNSHDLENGNAEKGLSCCIGKGTGNWRLQLFTELDQIEPLAFIRGRDGFVTSMQDSIPGVTERSGDRTYSVPIFNPASNTAQRSRLRLINPNSDNVAVQVSGVDDEGNVSGEVEMELAPGAAREVYANELEAAFGDGEGKWRLNVSSSAGTPEIWVMNLMETPEGHLSNLSRTAAARTCDAAVRPWCLIPLFRSTSNPDQQGFIRVVNLENSEGYDGEVNITAKDDARAARGPVSFVVQEGHAVHFNSDDLELGNRDKGLAGQLGRGTGDWYLLLFNDGNAVIKWLSLVRTRSGFLTNMNETVQRIDGRYHVSTFNPGSNASQRSWLRLVDTTGGGANVTIRGRDDSGEPAPEGEIQLSLDPTGVMTITAQEIEAGGSHFSGRFGDGYGKWQLFIEADSDIHVMSLMDSPTGHLTNLSVSNR